MPEEVKFTEEEIKKVKEIQSEYFDAQTKFGQLSVARIRMEDQMQSLAEEEGKLRNEFKQVQEKETSFLDEITKKYGEGSLNPETGVFTKNKAE